MVTGSAGGIGAAVREHLEAAGHGVIGVDLADAEVVADLGLAAGREAMVHEVADHASGVLDGVVAAAGVSSSDNALNVSVNFFGAVATLDGLLPLLARGTGGAAVAISSNSSTTIHDSVDPAVVAACLDGDEARARSIVGEGYVGYPSSKLALARWARRAAVSEAWIGAGVRLNVVLPGPIATPMAAAHGDAMLHMGDDYPVPIGRLGRPDEVATATEFLLSPASSYVVGTLLFVDGGGEAAARGDDWPTGRYRGGAPT